MTKPKVLIKQPKGLYYPVRDLMPGDILIFGMNPLSNKLSNRVVNTGQRTLNEEGGHSNTEHAAFIADINGELKIVHLLGRGFSIDSLDHIDKRTTHVYRIRNDEDRHRIGEKLSALVESKKDIFKSQLKWRMFVTFFAYIRRVINSLGIRNANPSKETVAGTNEQQINGSSICSKFVADCYIEACRQLTLDEDNQAGKNFKDRYMNIFSATAIKTLQAYLGRNANYNYFIIPHAREEIYNKLWSAIKKQADRLIYGVKNESALDKGQRLSQIIHDHRQDDFDDPYQAALDLLKMSIPILKMHRGVTAGQPTSYKEVMKFARAQGIYSSYLLPHVSKDDENTRDILQHELGYNDAEFAIYNKFRERGYSDSQAQFEVRPNFGDWLALNPRRITAVSLTGVGLFCVMGYGQARVVSARHRNAEFASHVQTVSVRGNN